MVRYGQVDAGYASELAGRDPDEDRPVYMLNLMKYREVADYGGPDGEQVSGREADDRYNPVDVLADIGARVCLYGDVVGSGEGWDRVGVVRYPNGRAFIEMQRRRDFQDRHRHKEAGMLRTIVMGTVPAGALPDRSATGRVLVEVWAPDRAGAGPEEGGSAFSVEGTILGDGRAWSGVRYTSVAADFTLPTGDAGRQYLLVAPVLDDWS